MLLPRLITSVIGIPIAIFAIYWGGIPFLIMMFAVVYLALHEFFVLASHGGYSNQNIVGTIAGLMLFFALVLNTTSMGAVSVSHGTALTISLILLLIFAREVFSKNHEKIIERLSVTFMGAFFVPWTLGHLVLLRSIKPAGMLYVFYLFIIIWILDTGAYAVGRRFGQKQLASYISPKKTIEGAFGGIITAVLTGMLSYFIFLKNYFSLPELVLISFVISVISQFSDLSESLLKRDVGVKDSANLLPGHGGMLDRFDSFLFTAPLFYYYLVIFKGN